ncbi:MAG: class I SAM-dependent methyltransferase [Beijerinckiaceae bacterium]
MRQRVKAFIQSYPAIFNPIWPRVYPLLRRGTGEVASEFSNNAEAFAEIHSTNMWGDSESLSGWGSTLAYTTSLRLHLARLLSDMQVKVFLDAPCGDFNWMSHVKMPPDTSYVGADIVPELIASLSRDHGLKMERSFQVIDIVTGPIPPADLWLCRDVLFHLPTLDSLAVLRNFAASEVSFLLTTTYDFIEHNADTRPGGFRYVNLQRSPFNLGKPRLKIPDFVAPRAPRYLGLWSREDVAEAISSWPRRLSAT